MTCVWQVLHALVMRAAGDASALPTGFAGATDALRAAADAHLNAWDAFSKALRPPASAPAPAPASARRCPGESRRPIAYSPPPPYRSPCASPYRTPPRPLHPDLLHAHRGEAGQGRGFLAYRACYALPPPPPSPFPVLTGQVSSLPSY
jgi:hypothetical protein